MSKPKHRGAWLHAAPGRREASGAPNLVAGRYRLESQLAKGGMGEVWAAYDKTLGRRVALKIVRHAASIDDAKARFDREVALSRQLRGPAFVEVYAHGTDGDRSFVAMELLEGETLQERIKRVGAMSTADALDFLVGVGAALRVAHSLMVVHRDLKPSNIFFARVKPGSSGARPKDGRTEIVKVLDFGIAKDAWDDARLTRPGVVMGSAHYMSPEQIRSGADVDVRSDLFSLGVLLYRVVTGERPFEGGAAEALARILSDPPRPATAVRASLPDKLDAFFLKALAKEPAKRFQTVDDLIDAFTAALSPRRPSGGWVDPQSWMSDRDGRASSDADARVTVLEKPPAVMPASALSARAAPPRASLDSALLEQLLPIVEPRPLPPPLPMTSRSDHASASKEIGARAVVREEIADRAITPTSIASLPARLPLLPPTLERSGSAAPALDRAPPRSGGDRPASSPSPWVARPNEVTARRGKKRSIVVEVAIVVVVATILVVAWRLGAVPLSSVLPR